MYCIIIGGIKMQFKMVECDYCHKEMVILEEFVRQPMFCTLGCMYKSEKNITKMSLGYPEVE